MNLLRFDRVALVRGGNPLFQALSLSVQSGDALHVRGANGVGKSSLLRLAAGLLEPTSGAVEAAACALSDGSLALDREQPLRSALLFWAHLAGKAGDLDDALAAFGIRHLADVPVRLLSTGQAKRASLVRLLATPAPIWLLDEPLNGLDADGAERLGAAIESHRQGDGAVIAASHVPLPGTWRHLDLGK